MAGADRAALALWAGTGVEHDEQWQSSNQRLGTGRRKARDEAVRTAVFVAAQPSTRRRTGARPVAAGSIADDGPHKSGSGASGARIAIRRVGAAALLHIGKDEIAAALATGAAASANAGGGPRGRLRGAAGSRERHTVGG